MNLKTVLIGFVNVLRAILGVVTLLPLLIWARYWLCFVMVDESGDTIYRNFCPFRKLYVSIRDKATGRVLHYKLKPLMKLWLLVDEADEEVHEVRFSPANGVAYKYFGD